MNMPWGRKLAVLAVLLALPAAVCWAATNAPAAAADDPAAAADDSKINLVAIGYDLGTNSAAMTMLSDMVRAVQDGGGQGKLLYADRDEAQLAAAMEEAVTMAAEPLPVEPEILLRTPVVQCGERIVCVHTNVLDPPTAAWIGFYTAAADDKSYVAYTFLNNLTERLYDVQAPDQPGEYHFRLFLGEDLPPAAVSDVVEVSD